MPFTALFYLLLIVNSFYCNLVVLDSGTYAFENDDMALIFYLTLENRGNEEMHVSVKMKQCIETVDTEQYMDNIYLIGGDMGTIKSHTEKNVTLFYPNLYLANRIGTCTVVVDYENEAQSGKTSQLVQEIPFNTSLPCGESEDISCESPDLDPSQNCAPVDCRIKYSGHRSYFNQQMKRCVEVPSCSADLDLELPNIAYNPVSNQCKDLKNIVTKADLELLENNNYKDVGSEFAYGQFMCHHGYISNKSGECICSEGWITSLENDYEPNLGIYHFCNVEINGWINVNKSRIKITALLIAIFAVTIASKILIIMCILSMCFKWAKTPKNSGPDDDTPLEKPCTCNEELIQELSKSHSTSSGNTKTTTDYRCDAVFMGSPFIARTPRSKTKSRSKSKSSTTSSSGEEEIHIYVERSKSSDSATNSNTKFSPTDFSIEFVDDGDNTEVRGHQSSGSAGSKFSASSKRVRLDHSSFRSGEMCDGSRNITSNSERDFTTDTRTNY